jgi:dethiobiotin synthetase
MRGLFITGTDTGVGKTILSAALVAAMRAAGEQPRAYKPVVTGLDDERPAGAPGWPPDHELLGAAAGMDPRTVSPISYGPAVSPHLAAELAGERITLERLLDGARAALGSSRAEPVLIVEGVGGLLVPFGERLSVRDLAVALALPVVIAARPGLGTINHTLLTLAAARAAGLDVRAVVLTPWPQEPSVLERSNRETIGELGQIDVAVLGRVEQPALGAVDQPVLGALARAGEALPWTRWLERDGGPGEIMRGT